LDKVAPSVEKLIGQYEAGLKVSSNSIDLASNQISGVGE